jgi:hypothetical protein
VWPGASSILEKSRRGRHVAVGEIKRHDGAIDPRAHARMRQDGLDLRAKNELFLVEEIKERLLADSISRQK